MNHAFFLSLIIAYRAFMGNLLLGVLPENMPIDANISSYYAISSNIEKDFSYKITKNIELISPLIDAKSSFAADLGSDKVLFSQNAYQRRPIASLTKLMTAIIVVDKANLDDVVTVSTNAASIIGSKMNLYKGERISVESLLYGLLIRSANDAAIALAEHISGSEEEFVKEMNKYVANLGLVNTRFDSAVGLDSPNNYSTAFEVYLLSKEFLKYQLLREIVTIAEISVPNETGGEHILNSTNKNLNSFLSTKGLKTGTTDLAGASLVNLFETDDQYEYIVVLLDSPSRFSEAKIIGEWILRAYRWE